jgi:hypothetical protein
MSQGGEESDPNVASAYEALNASYRMMDEYMRQSQRVAERLWMPWVRPFTGNASPFVPPEAWVRAYGDMAMAWMSMAQTWTRQWGFTPPPADRPAPEANGPDGSVERPPFER